MRKREREVEVSGTTRQIGLEGGIFAIITDAGESFELIDPPSAMKVSGVRVRATLNVSGADVSIGMIGQAGRVKSYSLL